MELIGYLLFLLIAGYVIAFLWTIAAKVVNYLRESRRRKKDLSSGFFYLKDRTEHTARCDCVEIDYDAEEDSYALTKYFLEKGKLLYYDTEFLEQGNEVLTDEVMLVHHGAYSEIWGCSRNDEGELRSIIDQASGVVYERKIGSNVIGQSDFVCSNDY